MQDIKVTQVSKSDFLAVFHAARQSSDLIADNTSQPYEVDGATTAQDGFYLDYHGRYGFVVKQDGELIAVFSMIKGAGSALIAQAIEKGARQLDCFDGYLVDFYKRNGFVETSREPNWTMGQPDVVYMGLSS